MHMQQQKQRAAASRLAIPTKRTQRRRSGGGSGNASKNSTSSNGANGSEEVRQEVRQMIERVKLKQGEGSNHRTDFEDDQRQLRLERDQLRQHSPARSPQRPVAAPADPELLARERAEEDEVDFAVAALEQRRNEEAQALGALHEELASNIRELCRLYEQVRRQEQHVERRFVDASDALRAEGKARQAAIRSTSTLAAEAAAAATREPPTTTTILPSKRVV